MDGKYCVKSYYLFVDVGTLEVLVVEGEYNFVKFLLLVLVSLYKGEALQLLPAFFAFVLVSGW
jgi:hypothetical protein